MQKPSLRRTRGRAHASLRDLSVNTADGENRAWPSIYDTTIHLEREEGDFVSGYTRGHTYYHKP